MLFKNIPDRSMLGVVVSRFMQQTFRSRKKTPLDMPVLGEQLVPPGVTSPVFNGFVTSKNNPHGLQLSIHHDKDEGVSCAWDTSARFEGYPQTLHGGVSFAILDELLAYAIFEKFRTFAVTLSSNTYWHGRIRVGTKIHAKAIVKKKFWRFVRVEGKIFNERGRLVVSMNSLFYMPTKSEFKKLMDLSIMPPESLPFCGVD